MKAMFFRRNDKIQIQFFRYVIVGGIAFGVDYSALFVLTETAHLHYLFSAAISFLLGLILNYSISIKWVFQSNQKNTRIKFILFGIIGIAGLGFNELIIWLLTEKVRLYYMNSKLVAAAIVLIWNFLARRKLMMRKK